MPRSATLRPLGELALHIYDSDDDGSSVGDPVIPEGSYPPAFWIPPRPNHPRLQQSQPRRDRYVPANPASDGDDDDARSSSTISSGGRTIPLVPVTMVPLRPPMQVPVAVPVPVVPLIPAHVWAPPPMIPYYHPIPQQHAPTTAATRSASQNLHVSAPRIKPSPLLQPYSRRTEEQSPLITISRSPMRYEYYRYRSRDLDQLATESSTMSLDLRHGDLPWRIRVDAKDARGVTVRDVLDTVWNELNRDVSEDEARRTRGHWVVLRHRETNEGLEEYETYDELKRYHWLRCKGETRFIGITLHERENFWKMVFKS